MRCALIGAGSLSRDIIPLLRDDLSAYVACAQHWRIESDAALTLGWELPLSAASCCAMRDPEDDQGARQALDDWLRERPEAGIVVAAIDCLPDSTLDVEVKLSRLTGYQLIGLVQALLQQAIDIASETPGAELDPDFERLQRAKALLEGESAPEVLQ